MKINISFNGKNIKDTVKETAKADFEEVKGNVKGMWNEYGSYFKAGFMQGAGCALGIIVVSKIVK